MTDPLEYYKSKTVEGIECQECHDRIWSRSRHDFRYCKCKAVAVDGGRAYMKINGDRSKWEIVEIELDEPIVDPKAHMRKLINEFPDLGWASAISAHVGPGWVGLLRPALAKLEERGCLVMQLKEKFGGLRLYWDAHDGSAGEDFKDVETAVEIAEEMSFKICDVCGDLGEPLPNEHGWIATRCEAHRKLSWRDIPAY